MTQYNPASIFSFTTAILVLAVRFRFSVTSWLRSPARNKSVGGVGDSWHLTALAVDVVLDPGEGEEAFRREAARLGLKCLDEGDHLHLQPLVTYAS